MLSEFKLGNNDNRAQNQQRLEKCRNRLIYFERHSAEEVSKIM